jgi:hypothetical protein
MNISIMLNRAINSKDVRNEKLDQLFDFLPQICTNEATAVIQTGISFFRNCSTHMTDWLCVDGDNRRELVTDNFGEQTFFSSDIRRTGDDGGIAPHDRVFMSVTFLDKPLTFEQYTRLDSDPQAVMYEHARRYECKDSDFLYAVIGVIHSVQQHEYVFFDTHEEDTGELMLLFYSSKNKYQLISIMLNFSVMLTDTELMDILDVDESQIRRYDEIDDADIDEFTVTPINYKH